MMPLKDLQDAAAALGNQLAAGVPVLAAAQRMVRACADRGALPRL